MTTSLKSILLKGKGVYSALYRVRKFSSLSNFHNKSKITSHTLIQSYKKHLNTSSLALCSLSITLKCGMKCGFNEYMALFVPLYGSFHIFLKQVVLVPAHGPRSRSKPDPIYRTVSAQH
jgi:hypothetical protein